MKNTAKQAVLKTLDVVRLPLFKFKLLFKRSEINRLKTKIENHALAKPSDKPLNERMFMSLAMRINSNVRQEIFEQTMKLSLGGLGGEAVTMRVADASPEVFMENNKRIVEKELSNKPNVKVEYNHVPLRQPPANIKVLSESKEQYFSMTYDDQAYVNVTSDFLAASCDLLDFFEGDIDMVFLEGGSPSIDDANKKVIVDLNTLEFRDRGIKPIGIVEFRGHKFAIIPNFHYGFFFNMMIAPREAYRNMLQWYVDNVSDVDSNKIELAGLKRLGPSFKYLAIPLNSCQLNLDFAHTEHSARGKMDIEKEVYDRVAQGYAVETRNKTV